MSSSLKCTTYLGTPTYEVLEVYGDPMGVIGGRLNEIMEAYGGRLYKVQIVSTMIIVL